MLDVQALRSGYGRINVLSDFNLRVSEGEFVGVLGHNGMGKSTLLRTVMGLIPATTGRVSFCGEDITRHETHRRAAIGIGYVPQGRQIFPDLTVFENLRMGCARSPADARETIAGTLELFPKLVRLLDRRGGGLSGGEQQLLALARCLCAKPRLLLLDEPTEGIQPSIIDEIVAILRLINRTRGVAILLVEQNLEFLTELAGRIVVIQRGRVRDELTGDRLHDLDSLARSMM